MGGRNPRSQFSGQDPPRTDEESPFRVERSFGLQPGGRIVSSQERLRGRTDPRVKRRELIRHLTAHGCVLIREGANHSWWGNSAKNLRSAVPRHTEINKFLARKICPRSGSDRTVTSQEKENLFPRS